MNLLHMKSIIKIDITTYIIILLSLFSASFKRIIILFIVIIFHELGHLFWLYKYHKKIINIKIYPFGGITKYESLLNHNIKEEIIISIGGIINQILLFFIIKLLFILNIINFNTYCLFNKSNMFLIIFNLLPIISLDGSKLLNSILEYFFTYSNSLIITIIISFISLIIFTIISISLKINALIILSYLYYCFFMFIRNYKYIKERFVLERILYKIPYNNIRYDTLFNKNKLRQQTYHYFDYIPEFKILDKIYKR